MGYRVMHLAAKKQAMVKYKFGHAQSQWN